nr:putative RNA-directed DNA polymerase, eukaryota, reverse transcriptase zinc-binding domain protein [Tanacetum cinerariifolium]
MQQMGFSHNWRKWIRGCLTSSFSLVIVNGSPTKEFDIQRGLRQGDLLFPFLFIIVVEALHINFQEAKAKGIFDGIKIGSNKVDVSHLQFTNDALILGKWSLENARTLCRILRCFNLASDLKVNFSKIKLFRVGVNASEIQGFANILDCQASTFPCSYLGLPIGANISKACNWKPIIENTLDCNKMAWVGWKKLAHHIGDGLGIGTPDQWACSFIGSTTYTVALMGKQLEHSLLSSNGETIRCLVCDGAIETSQHLFVECPIAAHIWDSIMGWWGLPDHPKDILNLIIWSDTLNLDNKIKACLDVVIQTTMWVIWNYRNRICFNLKPPRKDTLMEEIKVSSHTWILHRNKRFKPNWNDWVLNTIYSCNSCLFSL